MKINKVTITGADDKVPFFDLLQLSEEYKFVEWGILFSKTKEGTPRYPSKKWIDGLCQYELNLSAHFCGWYANEVLENSNLKLIIDLNDNFKRVQINCNFQNSVKHQLGVILQTALHHPERLGNKSIIFQYNKSNAASLWPFESGIKIANIDLLYDSSGGRGTAIKEIRKPFGDIYTGYSGGINTENIEQITNDIISFDHPAEVWIDMESGVRTNNEFDLDKVKTILKNIAKVIKKQGVNA